MIAAAHVTEEVFAAVREREVVELHRREAAYRGDRPAVALTGRDVVLVDDGLATGATMHAALVAARRQRPRRLAVAVPVGSPRACAALAPDVDELVCLEAPAASDRSVRPTWTSVRPPTTRCARFSSDDVTDGTARGSLFRCSHPGLDSDRATL